MHLIAGHSKCIIYVYYSEITKVIILKHEHLDFHLFTRNYCNVRTWTKGYS